MAVEEFSAIPRHNIASASYFPLEYSGKQMMKKS